jgi:hypothetical protein
MRSVIADLQPANHGERWLATSIAEDQWPLNRARALESNKGGGERYLSRVLAVYVKEGCLTRDEALEGAADAVQEQQAHL